MEGVQLQGGSVALRHGICPVTALGLSRLRGGRYACNTPAVMFHDRTTFSIYLPLAGVTLLHMIENP